MNNTQFNSLSLYEREVLTALYKVVGYFDETNGERPLDADKQLLLEIRRLEDKAKQAA